MRALAWPLTAGTQCTLGERTAMGEHVWARTYPLEALHHRILGRVARAEVAHGLVLFVALFQRLDHVDAARVEVHRQRGMHVATAVPCSVGSLGARSVA